MAVSVEKDKLEQILKSTKYLLNFKDGRALQTALRFEFNAGICRVIVTDAYRIGVFELPYSGESIGDFTIAYTPMVFSKKSTRVAIAYQDGEDTVRFTTGEQSYSVTLLTFTYPDWQKIVTMDGKPKCSQLFNRQLLIKTLQSMNDDAVILDVYGDNKPLIIINMQGKNTRLVLPMLKNN